MAEDTRSVFKGTTDELAAILILFASSGGVNFISYKDESKVMRLLERCTRQMESPQIPTENAQIITNGYTIPSLT